MDQHTPDKSRVGLRTFAARLRYAFDNTMSRGPGGLIVWLALVCVILVLGTSLLILLAGNDPDKDLPLIVWNILYQTLTPNPVDVQAGSPTFLGAMFFATLGSLLLVSVFIGILTNAIDHRIQHLRKGRSTVLESGHTLILGWSSQILTIVSELMIANAHHRDACIVILADRDKIEMEDEIRAKVPRTGRTRIVCRTGSPLDPTDLEMVTPDSARSIIILAPGAEDSDTYVIKTILSLTNNPKRKRRPYHIVADIHEPENMQVARLAGGDEAELVLVSELISHVTVQTCQQKGLSIVYTELLNFEGDELYFKEEPALVNRRFGETLFAYEDSTSIGLHRRDGSSVLNPPMETRIQKGDELIVIAEDDDTIRLSDRTDLAIDESAIQTGKTGTPKPEGTLILGWNRHAPHIINELDDYLAPGSRTTVVASVAEAEGQMARTGADLKNQSLSFRCQDTTRRRVLDELLADSLEHVIVLSYSDALPPQQADAQTLMTLLHLRDIRERSGKGFTIVSEMLDVRNRTLADVTRADDFIVSDHLVSLVLTQISENKYLNTIFGDLFDPEGTEIYLKPARDYVRLAQPLYFCTVTESARRRGQIAIGYRRQCAAHDPANSYGVVVNPNKSERVTFAEGDEIIVLAEH